VTPTLSGRLQTRIVLLAVVGVLWTLIVGPVLPRPDGASLGDVYDLTLSAIAVVAVVGLVWELIYHGLQQFRWEKDWPAFFGLLTGINEGLLAFVVLDAWRGAIPVTTYALHFSTTWLVVWFVANGPLRVVALRWRYRGGRFV
jgi:hypothetical protein